jgi:2-keto-4-pentenoate hydratase/2-oxohepta-3-ene-1,7-dioic acid hydratase in catechol pathway
MRFVTYAHRGEVRTGMLLPEELVVDLTRAIERLYRARGRSRAELAAMLAAPPGDLCGFLEGGQGHLADAATALEHVRVLLVAERAQCQREGLLFDTSEITLLAPIRRPGKLACMWVNYPAHGAEVAVETPKTDPVFFAKFPDVVIGPGAAIVIPEVSRQVDYEAELAVVIGKQAKNVPEDRAFEYIVGYTILNDVSARDFNLDCVVGALAPYVIQKTFDTFAPLGPALVTADEVGDPHSLRIRLWVDGTLLQDGNTAHMQHKIPRIVSYLSRVVTLRPGDVIATGTPPGAGHWRKPPRYLQPGDTVRIEIPPLGVLENPVIAACDDKKSSPDVRHESSDERLYNESHGT